MANKGEAKKAVVKMTVTRFVAHAEHCELCDVRSQLNDAVEMEQRYRADRRALRRVLMDLAVAVNALPEDSRFGTKAALAAARAILVAVEGES